jgi:queuine tRNA-ribosyltransferase
MMDDLALPHGTLRLPAYLPDATRGVVRSVDAADLRAAGTEALVMNVFHLMQKPGSSTIAALGGLHAMADWQGPIITDSGGFQAYSLIRQNPKWGSLHERGISFQPEGGERKFQLTPEKSVQLQIAYGTDIVICLDDPTHVDDSAAEQQRSVERTISWARRCKDEWERQCAQRRLHDAQRPRLFGVVQGGGDHALRRHCADALLDIGFDGYGYGGWPLDARGNLLEDMLGYTRSLIPARFPMHALGVGHPLSVVAGHKLGYNIFDSALPTRDARAGRLYTFRSDPHAPSFRLAGDWFAYLYLEDKKHIKRDTPISPGCDCVACTRYSVGYLHHLQDIKDTLFLRLATIHNLHVMSMLINRLRAGKL